MGAVFDHYMMSAVLPGLLHYTDPDVEENWCSPFTGPNQHRKYSSSVDKCYCTMPWTRTMHGVDQHCMNSIIYLNGQAHERVVRLRLVSTNVVDETKPDS